MSAGRVLGRPAGTHRDRLQARYGALSRGWRVPGLVIATVVLLLCIAVPGASASALGASTLGEEPGVDYHPVTLHLTYVRALDFKIANCTADFGVGSGHCGGDDNVPARTTSDPHFGDRPWRLGWAPCDAQCPRGAVFIQITAGPANIDAWIPDRSKGELTVLSAHVPSWHPLSQITGGNDPSAPKGHPGGPLYLYVKNVAGHLYNIDVTGYLRYKRIGRTFDASGFLDYAKRNESRAPHPFHVELAALDTPSSPQCFNDNFRGVGGCYGTFSQGSDSPFIGSGGSAGIHWREEPTLTLVTLIAPSGAKINGYLEGARDRLRITSGFVPPFGATDDITTGTHTGRVGEVGGPLRLTTTQCCSLYSPRPPDTRITRIDVAVSSHEAAFSFRAVGGGSKPGFWCALDRRRPRLCNSGKRYTNLHVGTHVFRAWAIDDGTIDPTPATTSFTISSTAPLPPGSQRP